MTETEYTAEQYQADLAEVEKLAALDPIADSENGRRLLELAERIEQYELKHFPMPYDPTPYDCEE